MKSKSGKSSKKKMKRKLRKRSSMLL